MDGPTRVRIVREISRESLPGLKNGPARITVTATRPVLFGLRQVETVVSRDVQVRLERPQLSVLSTHHYINQGGSEMIVYRATPADVVSGVTVGDREYPGYPAAGLGIPGMTVSDPAVRVAFFALLHDQDPSTPMHLFARDEAGNSATAAFESRTFPKTIQSQPDRAQRRLPEPCRAGHSGRHDRSRADGDDSRQVRHDQPRLAAQERRDDRVLCSEDLPGACSGAAPCFTLS